MGIASLIFGVMIFSKILNYLLGIYLIIISSLAYWPLSRTSAGKDDPGGA